jgi:hypothetical protein
METVRHWSRGAPQAAPPPPAAPPAAAPEAAAPAQSGAPAVPQQPQGRQSADQLLDAFDAEFFSSQSASRRVRRN